MLYVALVCKNKPFLREVHHLTGEDGGGRRGGHFAGRKQKKGHTEGLSQQHTRSLL